MGLWLVRDVPAWLAGTILVVGLPLIVLGLDELLHRLVPHHRLDRHNPVTGVVVSTVGIAYGVIIGLCVVSLWEGYTDDERTIRAEATNLSALVPASAVFGQEFQRQLTDTVIDYDRDVYRHWKERTMGEASPWVNADLARMSGLVNGLNPTNEAQRAFVEEAVERLATSQQLRQQSLAEAENQQMSPVMWVGVLVSTVAILGLFMFFGLDDAMVRRWLLTAAAVVIAVNLFLVIEMNYPFHGSFAVTPDAYRQVIVELGGTP